jgi:prevent-host-death family protein
MAPRVSATDAKNNFGGLLELVATRGRVEITRHGRVVAVVLAPRLADAPEAVAPSPSEHMIPPEWARGARRVRPPEGFDDP